MPVILTWEEDLETWLAAPWPEAAQLQRPLPDGSLRIVARGEKKDEAAAAEAAKLSGRGRDPRLNRVAGAARVSLDDSAPA